MFRHILILPAVALLAGCGGGGAGSASVVTSTTAMKTVMSSDTNPLADSPQFYRVVRQSFERLKHREIIPDYAARGNVNPPQTLC